MYIQSPFFSAAPCSHQYPPNRFLCLHPILPQTQLIHSVTTEQLEIILWNVDPHPNQHFPRVSGLYFEEIWKSFTLEPPKVFYMVTTFWVCQACLQGLALVMPSVWEVLHEHHPVKNLQFSSFLSCGILRHRSCDRGGPDLGIWSFPAIADGFTWFKPGGPPNFWWSEVEIHVMFINNKLHFIKC